MEKAGIGAYGGRNISNKKMPCGTVRTNTKRRVMEGRYMRTNPQCATEANFEAQDINTIVFLILHLKLETSSAGTIRWFTSEHEPIQSNGLLLWLRVLLLPPLYRHIWIVKRLSVRSAANSR